MVCEFSFHTIFRCFLELIERCSRLPLLVFLNTAVHVLKKTKPVNLD